MEPIVVVLVVQETGGVAFTIDDGTGRAIIDPEGAQIDTDLDSTSKSGTFDDPTAEEQAFLDRHGIKATEWGLNKGLRYREGVFEVGERIAILGQAVREPDLGGSSRFPILLSDSYSVSQRGSL